MASLKYFNDPGAGQQLHDLNHYSQAVRIPGTPLVKCSGQGGWDAQNWENLDENDSDGQVERAFKNVENVLRAAGLRGWEDVYLVRTYHMDIDKSLEKVVEVGKKYCPNHAPVWTAIQVARLGVPKMLIEVEVEAYQKPE